MSKEKIQSKNPEAQALDMARQVLGRVKEMDLTAESKKKVLIMIDEAKAEEKGGNKSKALNIYSQLLKYLEKIKISSMGEVRDDPKNRNQQLEIIDSEIKKNNYLRSKTRLIKALEAQRDEVMRTAKQKTKIMSMEDLLKRKFIPEFLSEKDAWDLIKNTTSRPWKWPGLPWL
ncbi:MAG: hypothetical protein NT116_01635 [Candidatus Parcubacteria bacterium]|nr:hypothetical protein [Candidatus Parcubacteria bacterium]